MFLNIGISHMGAGTAAFINMVEPMTSMIVSSILFHYHITVVAVIGCVLILCSLTFTALEDMKKQKADPAQQPN